MDRIRALIGDTLLITGVSAYSFFVFQLNQYGYLKAFGIFEASGLVSFQPYLIAQSVLATGFLAALILVVSIGLLTFITRLETRYSQKWWRFILFPLKWLPFFFLAGIPLISSYMTNRLAFYVLIVYILVAIPLTRRLVDFGFRTKKKNPMSFIDRTLSSVAKKKSSQGIILYLMLLVVFIPMISSTAGFINARTQVNFYTTEIDNTKYIIVKKYEDTSILVELKDGRVEPSFLVIKTSADDFKQKVKLTQINNLNFDEVKPYLSEHRFKL